MTTQSHCQVSLRDPGELIAAIPPLLGFTPVNSLVLVVFGAPTRDDPDCAQLRLTVRSDLPPPELRTELAEHLVGPVLGSGPGDAFGVAVIVVGGGGVAEADGTPPHHELPGVLEDIFGDADVPVIHALWAEEIRGGARWQCYDDPDCQGTVPDPGSTVVAATAAALGVRTYDSREDMAATLAPDDDESLGRRTALLEQTLSGQARSDATGSDQTAPDPVPPGHELSAAVSRGREFLDELIDRRSATPPTVHDQQVVDIGCALSVPEIRDGLLATAFTDRAPFAERLWVVLTRRMPAPYRAEPACLLGFSAYVRGDGALAGMALDQAMDACPGHRLAHLLRCALDSGFPPTEVRSILSELGSGGGWAESRRDDSRRGDRVGASPDGDGWDDQGGCADPEPQRGPVAATGSG